MSKTFMDRASVLTGTGIHRYLTLKLPLTMDLTNAAKLWEVSNVVSLTWNRFTEHQINAGWADNYYEIKKLLPEIKGNHDWLKNPSSQVLQEVAKSHAASTRSCKSKRAKTDKVTGKPSREAKANPPGFKAKRFFIATHIRNRAFPSR